MGVITSQATATILNGASLGGVVYLGAKVLVGIQMPAAWTAADLTFQASVDGVTFNDVYTPDGAGTEVTVKAAASRYIPASDLAFAKGMLYIKIRSGTASVPVVQLADRAIQLLTRRP